MPSRSDATAGQRANRHFQTRTSFGGFLFLLLLPPSLNWEYAVQSVMLASGPQAEAAWTSNFPAIMPDTSIGSRRTPPPACHCMDALFGTPRSPCTSWAILLDRELGFEAKQFGVTYELRHACLVRGEIR